MKEIVNGYIVVRKAEYNYDVKKRDYFLHEPLKIRGVFYEGIDRMPWFEIEEVNYQKNYSSETEKLWKELRKENNDFTGIIICSSFETAKEILDFCNKESPMNELIVIQSDSLQRTKKQILHDKDSISWLGYDVFSLGNWSLLNAGIFTIPASFQKWQEKLNEHGLFSNSIDAVNYSSEYVEQSKISKVEELPFDSKNIIPIRIGRVKT